MSTILRSIPPLPPYFAEDFVRGGWREVERLYGARTDLLLKWIEMSGGDELYQRRRDHMKANGTNRVYAGGNPCKPRGVGMASWLD